MNLNYDSVQKLLPRKATKFFDEGNFDKNLSEGMFKKCKHFFILGSVC